MIPISAVRKQVIHPIGARLVVTFPPSRVEIVCVINGHGRVVDLMLLRADLLQIKSRMLLRAALMVQVRVVFRAVAQAEEQTGAADVLVEVAPHASTQSPLEKRAAGNGILCPRLLRGRRGDGARLRDRDFGPARLVRHREGALCGPVGRRCPLRGGGRAAAASAACGAVHDAVMAAAVTQAACNVPVARAAGALARCRGGRHIIQSHQSRITHTPAVVPTMSGKRPYSLRGLPDLHP